MSSKFCTACGAPVRATARFCHRCGSATDGSGPRATAPAGSGSGLPATTLPWLIAGISLMSLLAFIVGLNFRRPAAAAPAADMPLATSPRAPDISQMSPEERADRLFQRVMELVSRGSSDSVAFFAPMAIQSQLALAPLDAHRRYDLGLLGMVSGDADLARAQADTILAGRPDHLLGLILAMRTAGMRQDSAARARYAAKLLEVVDRERSAGLQEYADHDPDITAAVREATQPPIQRQ